MGRMAMIGVALALGTAGTADAQRMVQHGPGAGYPPPGAGVRYPRLPQPPVQSSARWGSKVGGRWWGGANAPGGWAAYRAPRRGWRVPSYWAAPRFYITDWDAYGFSAPPQGYYWSRYYDDAVLIDGRGEVYDTVGGVDWDGYEHGYDERRDHVAPPPPPYEDRFDRRDHGQDRQPPAWVSGDGRTTVTVTTGGSAPVFHGPAYGYGYGGGTTTIVVQSAPVVTTTTTEIIEDSVTYTRPVVRHFYKKRVWRPRPRRAPRPRPSCACGS